jgi:hypothetical protein
MSAASDLIERLGAISDAEDAAQLAELAAVIPALVPEKCGAPEFEALLGVLERSPLSDGFESYWSIVHFLEACTGYEPFLVRSVLRRPAELSLTMINRLLNAGISQCEGKPLVNVLVSVAECAGLEPRLREIARDFLEYQHRREQMPNKSVNT